MTAVSADIADKYQGVASNRIINAVQKASAKTGTDFSFLMEKASAESSFNPAAKSKTSSATGLFQFVENTWLDMVKKYGAKDGLGQYANKITVDDNGKACVTDCATKNQILALRKNPEISAMMAGEYSAENKDYLQANVKGDAPIGSTELYLAHFMGAGGAAKFLNDRTSNPNAIGAKAFPKAAMANKSVFYDSSTGKPRTLDQIYDMFAKKFDDSSTSTTTDAGTTPPSTDATPSLTTVAQVRSASAPAATSPADPLSSMVAQALPSSNPQIHLSDIIWDKTAAPASRTSFARTASKHQTHLAQNTAKGFQKISSDTMSALLNMQNALASAGI